MNCFFNLSYFYPQDFSHIEAEIRRLDIDEKS